MSNYMLGLLDAFTPRLGVQTALGGGNGAGDILGMMLGSGLVVQFVLLLLIVFSVATWAVILTKYKVLWEAGRQNSAFTDMFWKAQGLSAVYSQTRALTASPLANIFRLGYSELGKVWRLSEGDGPPPGSLENIRRALARGQAAEATRLAKLVTFLATCANTAPFVGLFGTVWGIMDAFRSIGLAGSANLATVAPGIAEALVATATGLFAAIPAVVFYNHFNRRLQVLEAEMEAFVQDFLNLVERDIMRRKGTSADSVRPAGI